MHALNFITLFPGKLLDINLDKLSRELFKAVCILSSKSMPHNFKIVVVHRVVSVPISDSRYTGFWNSSEKMH